MSFLNQRDAPEIRRDIHDWKKEMRNHNDICPYMLSDRIFPISLCIMTYIIYARNIPHSETDNVMTYIMILISVTRGSLEQYINPQKERKA
jgi:hypothetical protein